MHAALRQTAAVRPGQRAARRRRKGTIESAEGIDKSAPETSHAGRHERCELAQHMSPARQVEGDELVLPAHFPPPAAASRVADQVSGAGGRPVRATTVLPFRSMRTRLPTNSRK